MTGLHLRRRCGEFVRRGFAACSVSPRRYGSLAPSLRLVQDRAPLKTVDASKSFETGQLAVTPWKLSGVAPRHPVLTLLRERAVTRGRRD